MELICSIMETSEEVFDSPDVLSVYLSCAVWHHTCNNAEESPRIVQNDQSMFKNFMVGYGAVELEDDQCRLYKTPSTEILCIDCSLPVMIRDQHVVWRVSNSKHKRQMVFQGLLQCHSPYKQTAHFPTVQARVLNRFVYEWNPSSPNAGSLIEVSKFPVLYPYTNLPDPILFVRLAVEWPCPPAGGS